MGLIKIRIISNDWFLHEKKNHEVMLLASDPDEKKYFLLNGPTADLAKKIFQDSFTSKRPDAELESDLEVEKLLALSLLGWFEVLSPSLAGVVANSDEISVHEFEEQDLLIHAQPDSAYTDFINPFVRLT